MGVDRAADDQASGRVTDTSGSTTPAHLRHDIRAAAATIALLANGLRSAITDEDDRERARTGIVECAQIITRLASDTAADRAVLRASVSEVVHASVQRARLTSQVDLVVSDDTTSSAVTGATLDIVRVVDNLIANACDAAGPGGRVTVGLTEEPDDVVIDIVDSGPGIEPDRTGRGLGLHIVDALVERLHGTVLVEKLGPDGGTRAHLVLPRREISESPSPRRPKP
jgi:signal transduction histidine kinase